MFASFKSVSSQIGRVSTPSLKNLVVANFNNNFYRNASSAKKKDDKKKGDKKKDECKDDKKKGGKKKAAIILVAPGAEEMEVVMLAATLRRASVKVQIAGLCDNSPVKCMHGAVLVPDTCLVKVKCDKFHAVIVPGGKSAKALGDSDVVGELLKRQEKEKHIIAAICSGPLVIAAHNVALGKNATSNPRKKDEVKKKFKYVDDKNVVQDGMLITSKATGTCFEFALKLAELLAGADKAKATKKDMLVEIDT